MTSPTLRELVDMLPGTLGEHCRATARYASAQVMSETMAHDATLGYLVRWLLDRGAKIEKDAGVYDILVPAGEIQQIVTGTTPLEAAVRAVGVISDANPDATRTG